MKEDKIPKVFISYSWNNSDFVLKLAERLRSNMVDVILDKWDLKPGQDKYVFMEKTVNDSDIDKVFIVCDKTYTEKANSRTGGVGDETKIFTNEVYKDVNQEKYITIAVEKDENGNLFVPTYLKSRIFIDFTNPDNYENSYKELLRNIYEKPKYSKSPLGKKPEWLDEDNEKEDSCHLKNLIKQIEKSNNENKQKLCTYNFESEYIETLKKFYIKNTDGERTFKSFCKTKSIRDIYLDFLEVLVTETNDYSEKICSFFENIYNTLTCALTYENNPDYCYKYDFDIFKIHIWELFIVTIAYLRYLKDYHSIKLILTYDYNLDLSNFGSEKHSVNYGEFSFYSHLIEEKYKKTINKRIYTLLGNEIFNTRQKSPVFSGIEIAKADLFLYQIEEAINYRYKKSIDWIPIMYMYATKNKDFKEEWLKMKSKHYCQIYMFPLFGVSNLDELKKCISYCKPNSKIRYNHAIYAAPAILDCIRLEEIGSGD